MENVIKKEFYTYLDLLETFLENYHVNHDFNDYLRCFSIIKDMKNLIEK